MYIGIILSLLLDKMLIGTHILRIRKENCDTMTLSMNSWMISRESSTNQAMDNYDNECWLTYILKDENCDPNDSIGLQLHKVPT